MKKIKNKNINTIDYWNNKFDNSYRSAVRKTGMKRYEEIIKYINKNSNILDIGSNFGDFVMYLKENNISFKNYTGFDFSDSAISYARKEMPNYTWIVGDCHNLNIPMKYNTIICMQTLEHVDKPITVLKEIYNTLTKHGQLLLSVPNMLKIQHDEHIWSYSEDELKNILINNKFNNVHTQIINNNKNILCIAKK
jgi:ubiquinone/menaquinone biosynthesis C-methylase UbiE